MVAESMSTSTESATQAKTVAVFGGGIAGLTAAHEFVKLGYKVKVFEANPDAGDFLEVPEEKKIKICLLNTPGMEWALGITIFSNSSRKSPLMNTPVFMTTSFQDR
ncbi:NAD(P)-binding protein [Shewanella sp. 5S214]|uniref:NAD(P)-binding protein n=1 Tax=Shewanella sp. 5S214 TaxID=3229999 RepID=UPI00352FE1A3